ncbi:MAG: hypothetical protein GY863_13235, partial [bacterium]|nr:hypothetical protein [bacterium]
LKFSRKYMHDERWIWNFAWIFRTGWPTTDISLDVTEGTLVSELAYGYQLQPQSYNAARLDPYHRMDIRVTRTFKTKNNDRVGLFLEIINLYNKRNIRNLEYTVFQPGKYDYPEMVETGYKWIGFMPSIGITWDR